MKQRQKNTSAVEFVPCCCKKQNQMCQMRSHIEDMNISVTALHSLITLTEQNALNDCYGKMLSIQILIVDWEKGISYWCPCMISFFNKMQIFLPFNSFMLWEILLAIKLYYSLHSFCIFWTFLFCLSALSHVAFLFFCFFFLLCVFAQ